MPPQNVVLLTLRGAEGEVPSHFVAAVDCFQKRFLENRDLRAITFRTKF
jgi:hypothetical protein